MYKTIITYGTFDLFHIGHLNLLKNLHYLGDRLIVAVSTDEFCKSKGKHTLIPFEQRTQIVNAIEYVDLVIAEKNWEQKEKDIKKHKVDIFGIGNDWEGQFDHLKEFCEVVYLDRTSDVSTKNLKNSLKNFLSIPREDIIKAFDVLEALKKELE